MKKIALVVLTVLIVFGLIPSSIVFAKSVSPTPWFTIIGAYVTIASKPANEGTSVDFFCQDNLAGHGETYDFSSTEQGILGWTHVYGSDLNASPQLLGCEEGDLVKVLVNGMRAVMSPPVYWTNDWTTHLVNIELDSQVIFDWGLETVASVGMFEESVGLRKWSNDGLVGDFFIQSFPFWKNYPTEEVEAWSLTNTLGKTKIYSSHDQEICPVGPVISFSKGGGSYIARVENTSDMELQVVLRLDDQVGPAGRLSPGGSFEVRNDAETGGIEVLIGDEFGALCADMEWNYRDIPAPRIVFVSSENRTVTIEGDNLFPYLGPLYSPSTFLVWFINPDWTSITYDMQLIWSWRGSWEPRKISFRLPDNFPAGTYMLKVSMSGLSSENGIYITVPEENKIFLPIIVR